MTLEEEGAYRRALDFCWLSGTLPNDPEKLARVIGKNCSIEVAKTVQQMFIVDRKTPENLLHERLEVERKKQKEFKQKKSKAGKASARKRKELSHLNGKNGPQQVLNSVEDMLEQKAQQNSTLQSSSSSADKEKRKAPVSLPDVAPVLKAVEEACCLDLSMVDQMTSNEISTLIGVLEAKHSDLSPEQLAAKVQAFGVWYYRDFFKGKHPSVKQVGKIWPQFLAADRSTEVDPHYGKVVYHRAPSGDR